MIPTQWRAHAAAHATCLAAMVFTAWLTNPLLHESFNILLDDPPVICVTLGGLAAIAAAGLAWPVSLRFYARTLDMTQLGREIARGAVLGLLAHGAESMAESLVLWADLLRQ